MTNPFYNPSGNPATGAQGLSALVRAEFQSVAAGFQVLPRFKTTGLYDTLFNQQGSYTLTLPPGPGTLALLTDTFFISGAAVATETTRATAAEAALNASVGNEATARNTAIGVETTRAVAAEGSLNTALAGKQPALGYTPVQQGTGIGQLGNVVKIGWTGTSLAVTVDATDEGLIPTTTQPQGFASATSVTAETAARIAADAIINSVISGLPSKNIVGWGVTGSGLDETLKCQQAIDACAGKYTLVFPAYLPTIVITGLRFHSGSLIQIDGTLFLKSGSFTHMFCGDDAGVSVARFSGSGTLNGNSAGNSGGPIVFPNPYCGGIVTTGFATQATVATMPNTDVVVTGLKFINIVNWPISLFCCDKAFIIRNRFYMYGNSVQVANGTKNFGIYFNDCEQTGDYAIAAYEGCSTGEIAFNTCRYVAVGVGVLNDGQVDTVHWGRFPNHDISIHHNRTHSTYSYGVGILNVATLASPPGAISTASNHYNIDVDDNIIIDSGIANNQNSAAGVSIVRAAARVRGNRIRWGGTNSYLWAGINGGGSDRCLIERNEISNGGILSDGTALPACIAVGVTPFATNTIYRLNEIFDDQAAPTMAFGFAYGSTVAGTPTDTMLAGCQWLFQTVKGMKNAPYKAALPFGPDTVVFSPSENITSTIVGKLAIAQDMHASTSTIDGILTVGNVQAALVNSINITASTETVSATGNFGSVTSTTIGVRDLNTNGALTFGNLVQAVSDADAATKGVIVTGLYVNGSQLNVRRT